ncbi:hypothetical protein B484DRAFT_425518, partial [Ochromonadaceae sp. CCMP2298]
MLRNYARSELWRLDWSLRTCISVACVMFLYLYNPLSDVLENRLITAPLAGFVTVLVKDITFGATCINGWSVILGGFAASFLSWLLFLLFSATHTHLPLSATLAALFCSTFVLQYAEIQPVGKKLGVSLLVLSIIGNRQDVTLASRSIWGNFLAILLGFACALVGCCVPPVRMAGVELKRRLYFHSEAVSALIDGVTDSWLRAHKAVQGVQGVQGVGGIGAGVWNGAGSAYGAGIWAEAGA